MLVRSQGTISDKIHTGLEAAKVAKEALWNGALAPDPYAVVACSSVEDVQQGVRFALERGRPVSVLGGGHDWGGRAALSGGIVLDLTRLVNVAFDPGNEIAVVGGGGTTIDLLRRLPADFAAVTGTISTVGVAGLTLGGGYGKLNSRFGLSSDNVTGAELVLADGSVVSIDSRTEPDLFWAIRGGGGNFGVVTSLKLKAHQVPAVLSAAIFVPLRFGRAALLGIQSVLDDAPDELSIFSALMTIPSGERGVFLGPLWSGAEKAGEHWLRMLTGFPGASVLVQKSSSYLGTFDLAAEAAWPKGRHYHLDARNVLRITDDVADELVACAETFPSPGCCFVIHDFRGMASRIPSDDTAFPLRRDHFNVQIISAWEAGREAHVEWAEQTSQRLAPLAIPGGYPSLLAPGEAGRRRDFYAEAVPKLHAVKRHFDPTNVFKSNSGQL